MKEAMCTRQCFHSPSATMYQVGQIAEVDETDPWVQANFNVPKPKKEAKPEPEKKPAGK